MTIAEAIAKTNSRTPNSYTDNDKIEWLNAIDGYIYDEILTKYTEEVAFDGYTPSTSTTTELLVPAPYDELYLYGLESKIHYYNDEERMFNNANAMFEAARSAFRNAYNSSHTHKSTNIKYV